MKTGGACSILGSPADEDLTPIDTLLADQRMLTAVERFAHAHGQRRLPAMERHYRRLLPATPPGLGKQYAFEVNLDKCSGCKSCVTACHSLNGLEANETWRTVGLLVTSQAAGDSRPGLQHITTACHHCADPGCLNGCPVLAYDKDPVTGIVRHLDDQCIGCSYCVMKCPYDVPKFSKALGIVRKCDMCSNRLEVGEAPACVQACPNEAIRIALVPTNAEKNGAELKTWKNNGEPSETGLPVFPDPSITQPTTRFLTERPALANMQAANAPELRPAPAHPPLSVMLVLTQFGVGVSVAAMLTDPRSAFLAWLALGATGAGVVAATLHLGQPFKAWRSFLGWRKSWLSRELLAFGAVLGAMSLHVLLRRPDSSLGAGLFGIVALVCSAMIYADTRRAFWRAWITVPKFALTSVVLATAANLLHGILTHNAELTRSAAMGLVAVTLVKLGLEYGFVVMFASRGDSPLHEPRRRRREESHSFPEEKSETPHVVSCRSGVSASLDARQRVPTRFMAPMRDLRIVVTLSETAAILGRSARLHTQAFRDWFISRLILGATGGVVIPVVILTGFVPPTFPSAISAMLLCLLGELIERHLFFVCEAAPRMPGGVVR